MIENGLLIRDETFAESCLADINYYRLWGFWSTLEDENGRFRKGVNFEDIYDIYKFD